VLVSDVLVLLSLLQAPMQAVEVVDIAVVMVDAVVVMAVVVME
jgi:hypothetical protein